MSNKFRGDGLVLKRDQAIEYGKRGGLRQGARHRVLIQGESVTTADIAERGNYCLETAQTRLRRAQAAPGPVTWASLGIKS